MVRTKADGSSRKAVAAKAPRKALTSSAPSTSFTSPGKSGGKAKYAGGNSVCPRPTPSWQKGINSFVIVSPSRKNKDKENEEPSEAGCSTSSASCEEATEGTSSSTETNGVHEENNTTESEDDED
ncbi:PCNA-associated factor-like [Glandiceps talaboti]